MCNLLRKVWINTTVTEVTLKHESGDDRNNIIFSYEDCYCEVNSEI